MKSVKFWNILVFFILFIMVFGLSPQSFRASEVGGVLIVKIKPGNSRNLLAVYSDKIEQVFDQVYRLRVPDRFGAINKLKFEPWVEYVQEDAVIKAELNASDPLFVLDQKELTKQWYLPKIQIHKAWEQTTGLGIIVAVVDTGIDGRHEDLNDGRVMQGYLSYCQTPSASNPTDCLVRITGEITAGANSDDNGHGTIVAGIIGAIPNNNKGIAGTAWNVRLMPIKVLDSSGSGLVSDLAAGIRWAADNGARIINLSVGGSSLQGVSILQEAVSYAFKKGVLIVAAAGNDAAVSGGNLNLSPILPVCADGGENMIVGVAATDINDKKARFSNYGSNCLDISAPGTGIFIDKQQKQGLVSTYFDPTRPGEHDLYVYAVGTSVAAPMVSGVAALMMSVMPDLDVRAIRDRLIKSVDNVDEQNLTDCDGRSCAGEIGFGRVNAYKALTSQASLGNGSLVKGPDGAVYLIERGLRRSVSNFVLGQRFGGTVLTAATTLELNTLPLGSSVPPVDGSIIKESSNPTVYLVEGGERQAMSYLAFISRGFRFSEVVTLEAREVITYPQGREAAILDGALIKTRDHPAVFILSKGEKQLLSYFVFKQRGFENKPIAVLEENEIVKYPTVLSGYLYPPLEGTLIRGDMFATVYMIENGKRRGMNLAAFQNRGYRFEDVKILPQSEADGYEPGGNIIE